jgi:hypothetical protein
MHDAAATHVVNTDRRKLAETDYQQVYQDVEKTLRRYDLSTEQCD